MKRMMAVVALMALAVGCGEKPSGGGAPGESVVTAPVDYLGAAAKAKKSADKTIETVALNQAISMFHATEGRFPRDLNELVTERYLPQMPVPPHGMKIEYDAGRGQARIVPK